MANRKIDRKKINNILALAGGEINLSFLLTNKFKSPVSQFALRQWLVRGIPEKYWPTLAEMTSVPEEEICKASGR